MEHKEPIEKTEVIDTDINIEELLTDSIIVADEKKPNPLVKDREIISDKDLEDDDKKEETIDEIIDDAPIDDIKKPVTTNLVGVVKKLIEKKVILPFEDEKSIKADFGEVEDYLYIPNNAVLKSGAFNSISKLFNLKKS